MITSTTLKTTTSRCLTCGAACPAEVVKSAEDPARVFLVRHCPDHGEQSVCISSDARFYWLSQGADRDDPASCCGGGGCCSAAEGSATGTLGRNANVDAGTPVEALSTCLALIEIVDSCNLSCPTCYADSPAGVGRKLDFTPLDEIEDRVQGVIDRKGPIEILQLSGGEPTLHPDFCELLAWTQEHASIDYVLINTNGVRIARDAEFATALGNVFRYGKAQLYLQFDGPQESGQAELRGADLRELREQALARCAEIGLPVTLAMTVTPANLPHLWDAVLFGLRFPHVRGISFQPLFFSGRNGIMADATERLNTADIIVNAVAQSGGQLHFEDFTPLPCGDPNCATIGYLLKTAEGIRSISEFIDFAALQGFLQDRVRYQLEDLAQCGCESEPLGELLHQFEMDENHTFRLFIKPFMDHATWDEDRIDRCCTHVIRPDGKLDSFCRYYANGGAAAFSKTRS
ncbi:MAG: radical SAM protein [Verrucomicrobiales bacterium]